MACAGEADRELRTHALKALIDRPDLPASFAKMVHDHLSEPDPFARRAAAEVLGAHPALANVRPLLALRQSTSPDDTHLIHIARMALRDQLKRPDVWSQLETLALSESDRRDIADVATGVHTPQAAAFLLAHLNRYDEPLGNVIRFVHHVARYGVPDSMGKLVALVEPEKRSPAERLELLKAMQQGAQERGSGLDESARRLAARLAQQLLGSKQPGDVTLGIDVVRDFGFREMQPELKKVIERGDLPDQPRTHAMGALTVIDPQANLPLIAGVLGDARAPIAMREWAPTCWDASVVQKPNLPSSRTCRSRLSLCSRRLPRRWCRAVAGPMRCFRPSRPARPRRGCSRIGA